MSAGAQKTRLGRGLASLIGDRYEEGALAEELRIVSLAALKPGRFNPRRSFAEEQLEELAASIRERGLVQPLVVRPSSGDTYEIVAGERRWRAAQLANLHDVPVVVRALSDQEAVEIAIIENVQRADLNPLEEAQGYGQLMEQFGYTQQDLAQVIGKSRSHVANTLRLLKLPPDVRDMLTRGELTAGHARTLITAEDPLGLARRIVSGGLSVRAAEELSQGHDRNSRRAANATPRADHEPAPGKDADTVALEKRLSDALGLVVAVEHREPGGGRLEIRYKTLEQLDDLCLRLTSR